MSSEADRDIWRPLRTVLFALQYRCFGLQPLGYHAVSLALFAGLLLALLLVLRQQPGIRLSTGAVGVLALGWHPLGVESVAWISSQGDLAAGLLALLCLGQCRRPWIALPALALALLAKESAVPLVAVLAVLWYVRPPGLATPSRWTLAAAAGLTIAYLLVRQSLLERGLGIGAGGFAQRSAPLAERVLVFCQNLVLCVQLFVAPLRLSVDYGQGYPWTPGALDGLLGLVVLGGFLLAVRRGSPNVRFWLLLGALFFLPTSGLLFPMRSSMAERFLLLPTLALAVLAGLLGARGNRPALSVALAVWLLWLAARTVTRTQDWTTQRTLFAAELRVHPDSIQALRGFAAELVFAGQLEAAVPYYQRLLERTDPHDIRRAHVLYNYALVEMQRTERIRGIPLLEECRRILLREGFVAEAGTELRRVWVILGNLYLTQAGLPEVATEVLEEGVRLFGRNPDLLEELGFCLQRTARPEEAIALYREALAGGANSARIFHHLGETLESTGRHAEAAQAFEQARRREAAYETQDLARETDD